MIYLDNAATTFPKPGEVYEKTFAFMREAGGNPGRGGHHYSVSSSEMIDQTRRSVARLFGLSDYRRVVFTYNCTDSINLVLKGLIKGGDHVIATNLDHNSVSRPLESLGVEVSRLVFDESGHVNLREMRDSMKRNTKLIVLNHGSNVLGSIQDWKACAALASEAGVFILLDAAQTAGRLEINLGDAPIFLACSGHKALYAMPGIGILTVPPGAQLPRWREGGTGTTSESLQHPEELPMRLEAGTPNFLAIASIRNGIDFIEREGMEKIHEAEMKLARRLYEFLTADPHFIVYSNLRAGQGLPVISFNLRNAAAAEVAEILDQHFGIAVRAGLHCAAVLHAQLGTLPDGCVRVSPGYFNTAAEMDVLIGALKQISKEYKQ